MIMITVTQQSPLCIVRALVGTKVFQIVPETVLATCGELQKPNSRLRERIRIFSALADVKVCKRAKNGVSSHRLGRRFRLEIHRVDVAKIKGLFAHLQSAFSVLHVEHAEEIGL